MIISTFLAPGGGGDGAGGSGDGLSTPWTHGPEEGGADPREGCRSHMDWFRVLL